MIISEGEELFFEPASEQLFSSGCVTPFNGLSTNQQIQSAMFLSGSMVDFLLALITNHGMKKSPLISVIYADLSAKNQRRSASSAGNLSEKEGTTPPNG